jgi:hypothetical protein
MTRAKFERKQTVKQQVRPLILNCTVPSCPYLSVRYGSTENEFLDPACHESRRTSPNLGPKLGNIYHLTECIMYETLVNVTQI